MDTSDTPSSSDIRQCYDYEFDDRRIAASILDTRPPLWHGSKNTSGMDCLIVVLRRIYSFAMLAHGVSEDLGWVQESERMNPILGHAWHVFGQGSVEESNATMARSEVEKTLKDIKLDPNASFYDLCCSSLMNKTFWSKDVFRLSEPPFNTDTGEAINMSMDDIATSSIVQCRDGRLVFYLALCKWSDIPACFVPSQPWVVRVLFTCTQGQGDKNSFSLRRTLNLPVWEEIEEGPTLAFKKGHPMEYNLLAVVRLRDEELGGNDYVRTYSPYGPNIVPEYEPASFMSTEWSVESEGKYMLFYGISPHDLGLTNTSNFPEVAGPDIVDEELVKDFKELMASLRKSEPSTQVQEEPSSSTTVGAPSRGQKAT
ncbi:uncharacterized protein FSUBG_6862 [Fusarium subglutinans]|uniref:Uncharacterized protein n=1 Tax=Gibberella subglutinans TaxID=42677 RepID=A0A8H5PXR0_GIBSU|nr:uncharacterized protein FSUBG_6862 [Fusarium subglutinans]KAF5604559.1 hypothetical protein FSUBG_6862 [Fusarium subglutinans]